MDSNYKYYNYLSSFGRLDGILNLSDLNYEEVDKLPDRDGLTYSNGFYANCSALFIDIRDSSKLASKTTRPVLAKIYRAYISELVAVLNGSPNAREINIVGDCVWGVFNTPYTTDIDELFDTAAQANSLIKTLNYKLYKKGYPQVPSGLGMAYGRALMIKAGYSGSGISDVVYMGDVVNEAAKLAAMGGKNFAPPFMVQNTFQANLNDHNKGLLRYNNFRDCYEGNVIWTEMDEWYKANCP